MTNHSSASWFSTLGKYTLVIALFALCVWAIFGTSQGRYLLQSWLNSKTTITVTTSPIIVTKLQSLNRLETASQVSQQVVEASADHKNFPAFLGQDRLMMQVQTEMIAGIDMSRLTLNDVKVQGNTVTVRMPAPELFTVRIDDEHSKVFSRERGWLVFTPDINLESEARLKVLAEARETGQTYLIPTARTNAETNLRQLLASFGFDTIEIHWADQVS
ncbi:MAG: DUF4230 domain-containing protein [bacterium]